jgi:hypothetical protein
MGESNRGDDFIPAGLAAFGIEADEVELAVMQGAQAMFWPPILDLFAFDTSGARPEPRPDLSRPPA